jgi:hypothetical protein
MNTCIDSRYSTYRDPTGEMTSVVAPEGQLNRAASEPELRVAPSRRGRGSKERGVLTPRTLGKMGIFHALSNAMKGKKSGGKQRESQSSEPTLTPIPNLEEDDILAEIGQQEREACNYFGTDLSSSFSSIGASSMSDNTDFYQRPAADPRITRSPPARSKSASTSSPTTPPTRSVGRYNSWLLRQNNVEKNAKNVCGTLSPPKLLEKEQNGWESPLATATQTSTGLRNSAAYGGLPVSSPRPPLPRPPLAGLPLYSGGITTPISVQKGEVNVRESSPSSVPKSKVPRAPRGNVSSVRGREPPPLSPARSMSRSYSPPTRDSPAIVAPSNQNEFLGPPLNEQPLRGSRDSPLCARRGAQRIHSAHHPASPIPDPERTRSRIVPQPRSGITTPISVQKGKVDVKQSSPSSVPTSKVPMVPRGNLSSVRGREQPSLSPARSYSPPPRDSPAIALAPSNQNNFLGPPLNEQPLRGSRNSPPCARRGAQSIPLAHHPASSISDLEVTRSHFVAQRSDSGRNVSGRCLTLTPTKPDASPSSKAPNSNVAGSIDDMKESIQRSGSAHKGFRSQAGLSQIEIAPGILKPLRGSEETWKAIETGNIVPTACISCSLSLHCLDDAEYVICPACRVVGPVECCLQGFGRGIGLGVKDEQLAICRAEIQSRRS